MPDSIKEFIQATAGPTVKIIDPETGEIRETQVFVATLGASSYTYVEAQWSQNLESFIQGHIHVFEFFGGVPKLLVPDNLKSAVKKSDRYEPVLNRTYREMASHYKCTILPARPLKPRDKAKVEAAVLQLSAGFSLFYAKEHSLA
jgi:transposase